MRPDSLVGRFLTNAVKKDLFPGEGIAVVCVSGGADSVALLDLMVLVAGELGVTVEVAHVNHGTGEWSSIAEAAVRDYAVGLGVLCHCRSIEIGKNWTETEARDRRLTALGDVMGEVGGRYLVTGHHSDDQVETVLLRFLKGSGMAGLAGIGEKNGRNVRPLLDFSSSDIDTWIEDRGLSEKVVVDPSNLDLRHDRNWIRHELLPSLSKRFGDQVLERVLDVGRHARLDRLAWAETLKNPELEVVSSKGCIEVARAPIERYDKVLGDAVLMALARELGVVLGRKQIGLVRRFVAEGTSGHSLDVGSNCKAELVFDKLRFIFSTDLETVAGREVDWSAEGGVVEWAGWRFCWSEDVVGKSDRVGNEIWVLPGKFLIRSLSEGDKMAPFGGRGVRPVRRLFMEAGVSRSERWRYPVVTRNDQILWVPGVCRADFEVPNAGTKAIRIEANRI